MWSRKVLKEKAKERIHVNYWKMVLVGLIVAILTGSGGSASSVTDRFTGDDTTYEQSYEFDGDELYGMYGDNDIDIDIDPGFMNDSMAVMGMLAGIMGIITLILIPLSIFVFNPLLVGCKRFFYKNIQEKAGVGEVGSCFDKNYLNCVKIIFLQNLFTGLWTLLFIIPGIVKSYEYRMIPYLLAENPDISREDAFAISKRMMDGNKWNAFVFDLSFLGWFLLGGITLGLVDLFYVNPYYYQADAMLYDAIKIEDMQNHHTSTGYGAGFGSVDQSMNQQMFGEDNFQGPEF